MHRKNVFDRFRFFVSASIGTGSRKLGPNLAALNRGGVRAHRRTRRRAHNLTRADVELRSVPRASHDEPVEIALAQRAALVRTGVVQTVYFFADLEQSVPPIVYGGARRPLCWYIGFRPHPDSHGGPSGSGCQELWPRDRKVMMGLTNGSGVLISPQVAKTSAWDFLFSRVRRPNVQANGARANRGRTARSIAKPERSRCWKTQWNMRGAPRPASVDIAPHDSGSPRSPKTSFSDPPRPRLASIGGTHTPHVNPATKRALRKSPPVFDDHARATKLIASFGRRAAKIAMRARSWCSRIQWYHCAGDPETGETTLHSTSIVMDQVMPATRRATRETLPTQRRAFDCASG